MAEDTEPRPSSGAELVPLDSRWVYEVPSGGPATATDLAIGTLARAARGAWRIGGIGWNAASGAARLAGSLPGAGTVERMAGELIRPLVDDGREARHDVRTAAGGTAQRIVQVAAPAVVDTLDVDRILAQVDVNALVTRIEINEVVSRIDIDALVSRIAIDALVSRIEIDTLVSRIDIDKLVSRIEIDALVSRIDIDKLVSRIDIDKLVSRIEIDALVSRIDIDKLVSRIEIDRLVSRIDVDNVVQRVDVDKVVQETELGSIVARSTSGFASEALDVAREGSAGADTLVSRVVNRVMRRREDEFAPGPPKLIGEIAAREAAERATAEAPGPDGDGSP